MKVHHIYRDCPQPATFDNTGGYINEKVRV